MVSIRFIQFVFKFDKTPFLKIKLNQMDRDRIGSGLELGLEFILEFWFDSGLELGIGSGRVGKTNLVRLVF